MGLKDTYLCMWEIVRPPTYAAVHRAAHSVRSMFRMVLHLALHARVRVLQNTVL